jgi:pseudaminic acid biosynthesis-associated methylase
MNSTDSKQMPLDSWSGEFGDEYTKSNIPTDRELRARTRMWSHLLDKLVGAPPKSILEVGPNRGANVVALKNVTDADILVVEPNETARNILVADKLLAKDKVLAGNSLSIPADDGSVELAFTSGVLIHVAPEELTDSCREIYRVSSKYIVCIEYYSDTPTEKTYRDQEGLLFKRDFGGFWWDLFPEMTLVDYGFIWERVTGIDNPNWWIFKKP